MPSVSLVLLIGFVLGVRHAADPDHIIAVSTIVSRQGNARAAARIGAIWGLGHTGTVVTVGGVIALFRVTVPPRVGLALELAVAAMLIVFGIMNLSGLPRRAESVASSVRPFVMGVVHGLAGSAAVALLVLAAIPDPRWSLAYLFVFGVGTIAGMVLITMGIALPMQLSPQRFTRFHHSMRLASGAISVAFGIFLVHQIGVVVGLFAATPRWDPH